MRRIAILGRPGARGRPGRVRGRRAQPAIPAKHALQAAAQPRSARRRSSCSTVAPTRTAAASRSSRAPSERRTRRTPRSSARPSAPTRRSPRAHDGKTFAQFYGTGKHGNNAFGKCVSSKAKALTDEQQQATIAAAKTCKAERTKMGAAAFTEKYGGRVERLRQMRLEDQRRRTRNRLRTRRGALDAPPTAQGGAPSAPLPPYTSRPWR